MNSTMNSTESISLANAKYKSIKSSFFKKGVTVAMLSGVSYGLYTSFLTLGMSRGVWGDWYGKNVMFGLSAFVITYMLGAIGSAINDTISGIWCLIIAAIKGKLGDFFRTLHTKPGAMMMLCAIVGGPIASTAYVVALQMGGSMIIPITALCPAIGAILGHFIYKQKLNLRMVCGIIVCFLASALIGGASFSSVNPKAAVGCLVALIAAFGWGIEGCVAGYGTSLIDYEIGITIRQCTSGLSNLVILVPIFAIMDGHIGLAPKLVGAAITSGPAIWCFVISGFFAVFSFSLWYKGNSMCGAPLGMTCNGTYSFWGPFFSWIILGVIVGMDGWALQPIQWISAVVMIIGILLIAVNPLELFKKKEN